VSKLPTRSPTHEEIELARIAAMVLELEDIAQGDQVPLPALVELAEDRGRPASHYIAAIPLASEFRLAGTAPVTVKICAGNCQRYGALDLIDHLVDRMTKGTKVAMTPVTCLDRCDHAPAAEVHGAAGQLVLAPATTANLDEAIEAL